MSYREYFSKQASAYAKYRPDYPDALYDYLASALTERRLAWDCATGNGQAARGLARHFTRVIATDISQAQIREAFPERGITYHVAPAEASPLESGSVNLTVVAQAIHWLDLEKFFTEVRRVSAPGALLAVWGYGFSKTEGLINQVMEEFGLEFLGPYWSDRLALVNDGYRNLPFPFERLAIPALSLSRDWTLSQYEGYTRSWSASQIYRDKHGGEDPFAQFRDLFQSLWGPSATRRFSWDMKIIVGRV